MAPSKNLKQNILEEHFFRPKWYSVFINPYFINRRSIFRAVRAFAENVPESAAVLDVGCGIKPYRGYFRAKKYVGIDIAGGGHSDEAKSVDAFYDGLHIPFPDASFDALVCTQVLEHATDAEALAAECARVLKPGGRALFSMPFIYPEHEKPYDFRRFTRFEHDRLRKEVGFTSADIRQTTGIFGTFAQLFVIWIFEGIPFRATVLKTLLSVLILAPIQIKGLFLDWIFRKSGPTMDYVITLVK